MRDEEFQISRRIATLRTESPLLTAELHSMLSRRVRVNDIHRARISRIYTLQVYNGARDPGIRISQDSSSTDIAAEGVEESIFTPDEDDAVGDQLDGLTTYLENLSLNV